VHAIDAADKEIEMRKLLTNCGMLVPLYLLAACVATAPGLGDEAGSTTLPSGLTLLDSDESRCDGTVQVADETFEDGGGLDDRQFVEPGENATFTLSPRYDEIEWACVGQGSSDVDSMRCPRGTSHVRVTRATTGGEILFECYG
jgi:hypothetical protein